MFALPPLGDNNDQNNDVKNNDQNNVNNDNESVRRASARRRLTPTAQRREGE